MKCPQCPNGNLAPDEVEGIAVDRCGDCKGIWIGEEGLRMAKDEADENLVWFDLDLWKDKTHFSVLGESLSCPSCESRLHRVRYASPAAPELGVDIDYCRECRAVWLGEGELSAIVRSMEDEVARMSSADLLRASLSEAALILNGPEPLALEWRDLKRVLQLMKGRFFLEHPTLERLIQEFPKGTPFQ